MKFHPFIRSLKSWKEFSDLQPINAIEGLPEINVEASFEQKKIQELQDKIDDLLSKGISRKFQHF